jgi:hypothetical protein
MRRIFLRTEKTKGTKNEEKKLRPFSELERETENTKRMEASQSTTRMKFSNFGFSEVRLALRFIIILHRSLARWDGKRMTMVTLSETALRRCVFLALVVY